jgi:hypothetical protein
VTNSAANNIGNTVNLVIVGVITGVVFLLVGVALGPTVISTAAKINATALTSVTMGSVLVTLATFISFFYYLGIVLGAIAIIWGAARVRGGR